MIKPLSEGSGGAARIAGIVEKTAANAVPSDLAAIGRYVFTPDIFDHLLERHALTEAIFASVNAHLADKGIGLRSDTLVDATRRPR